jgi:hypothetical protein
MSNAYLSSWVWHVLSVTHTICWLPNYDCTGERNKFKDRSVYSNSKLMHYEAPQEQEQHYFRFKILWYKNILKCLTTFMVALFYALYHVCLCCSEDLNLYDTNSLRSLCFIITHPIHDERISDLGETKYMHLRVFAFRYTNIMAWWYNLYQYILFNKSEIDCICE